MDKNSAAKVYNYPTADEIRELWEKHIIEFPADCLAVPEHVVAAVIGHKDVCVGCATECAKENMPDSDEFTCIAAGVGYLTDSVATCYCEG